LSIVGYKIELYAQALLQAFAALLDELTYLNDFLLYVAGVCWSQHLFRTQFCDFLEGVLSVSIR
jgi:hypothetical protein